MIELKEHKSSSYAPRTYHNASQGVTLAVAVNHYTAGEKLTQKAAGDKIVKIDYFHGMDELYPARALYVMLKKQECPVVNVAGNGIYTLATKGVTQKDINQYVYNILKKVHEHLPLSCIVSGGQTGADLAGLVAGYKLGIQTTGMWPNGYKMRFEDGKDVNMNKEEILKMIIEYAEELK